MKQIWLYLSVCSLFSVLCSLSSCREESDDVPSFGQVDYLNFYEANSNFKGQFEAIWTALNCNYALWDYEEKHGLDWDKTYSDFLPKFIELDKRQNNRETIKDDEILSLYKEVISPLHDGHLSLYVKNPQDKKSLLILKESISPADIRNSKREDYADKAPSEKDYYYNESIDKNRIIEADKSTNGKYEYCLFEDDVVYLRLADFRLSDSLDLFFSAKDKPRNSVQRIWMKWFNKICDLHEAQQLKGIIIDIRDNGGGYAADLDYAIGALQPSDTTHYSWLGYNRIKTGIGRLDYSVLIPSILPRMNHNHIAITDEPIAILVNCNSASTAELCCLSAKKMKNAHIIGMQTWGALSSLFSMSAQDMYSITYSGHVGSVDIFNSENSFFIYIPHEAFFSDDFEILESIGIKPDIEVRLDNNLYQTTGRDTQLERALEYIHTGK